MLSLRQKSLANLQTREAIKNLLKRNKATYADLAKALKVSVPTIKQMMSKGQFTLDRLEAIANWFSLSLNEFFEIALKSESVSHTFTAFQEEILAQNPLAMLVLFQISAGFQFEDIKKTLDLNQKDWQLTLFALDRAELIELQTSGQIRIKVRGPYFWNPNGKLEKAIYVDYLKMLISQISSQPSAETLQTTFELYLTKKLYRQLKNEMSQLVHRYFHLSRLEAAHTPIEKLSPYNAIFFLKNFDGWGPILRKKAGLKKSILK